MKGDATRTLARRLAKKAMQDLVEPPATEDERKRRAEHLEYLAAVAQNARAQKAIRSLRKLVAFWEELATLNDGLSSYFKGLGTDEGERMAFSARCTRDDCRQHAKEVRRRLPAEPKRKARSKA